MAARTHVGTAYQFSIQVGGNRNAVDWSAPGEARPVGNRDQVATLGPVADAFSEFVQWMDVPSFNAYLAAARGFGDAAAIDALPSNDPRGQLRAVWGAWENVMLAFRSINIPVQTWDRFRRVWTATFGSETTRQPLPTQGAIRQLAASQVAAAATAHGGPNWLAQNFGGTVQVVRIGGLPPHWLVSRYAPDVNEPWDGSVFADGRRGRCSIVENPDAPVADNSADTEREQARAYFTGPCVNPTGDWHTFFPGQQDELVVNRFVAEAACGFVSPGDPRGAVVGELHSAQGGGFEDFIFVWGGQILGADNVWRPDNSPKSATGWPALVYAVPPGSGELSSSVWTGSGDRFASPQAPIAPSWRRDFWVMRHLAPNRLGRDFADHSYLSVDYFPSLFAYWSMLFMPVPGLRVGADPELMYSRSLEAGDISLVEYMAAVGAEQLVREIRVFATRSNIDNSALAGIANDVALYSAAPLAIIGQIQEEIRSATQDQNMARAISEIAQAGSRGIGSAFGPVGGAWGAAVGAVIGAGTSIGLLTQTAFQPPVRERIRDKIWNQWKLDMFGNLMTRPQFPTAATPWGRPFLTFFLSPSQVALETALDRMARALATAKMPNGWPGAAVDPLFGDIPFTIRNVLGIARDSAAAERLRSLINEASLNPASRWAEYAPGLLAWINNPMRRATITNPDGTTSTVTMYSGTGTLQLVANGWTPGLDFSARLDGINDITGLRLASIAPGPHTVTLYSNGAAYATLPVAIAADRVTVLNIPGPSSGSWMWWLAGGALAVYAARRLSR